MLKMNAVLIGWNFFLSEMETGDFVLPVHPRTLICYRHFDKDFIFSINLYGYQNVLKH